jgi:hypothetical protein
MGSACSIGMAGANDKRRCRNLVVTMLMFMFLLNQKTRLSNKGIEEKEVVLVDSADGGAAAGLAVICLGCNSRVWVWANKVYN